jgi:ATP-binding cassette subfamily C protein
MVTCLIVAQKVFLLDGPSTLLVLGLFYRLYPRLSTLQQLLQSVNLYLPAFDYVAKYESRAEAGREIQLANTNSIHLPSPFHQIDVDDVSVRYGELNALQDVSIDISAGEYIGIVGRSGAGKTTLLDCLLGLIIPGKGQIRVDGVDLKDASLTSWRSRGGYVGQDTILFNTSVRDNILWNQKLASEMEVRDAARMADADDFITSFPEGYETLVGDRGGRVSGGQRQRIGIARALLRKPEILILDEATSALDPISEGEILRTVERLKHRLTVVFVTHRITSLRGADRIFVLEQGRLIESGSWKELSQNLGMFSRLLREMESIVDVTKNGETYA